MPCKSHKFVHYDTKFEYFDGGYHTLSFYRYDFFFCEKCLEKREEKRSESSSSAPYWFDYSKAIKHT